MGSRFILGIDPGASGGIAVYDRQGGVVVRTIAMPDTPPDIYEALKSIRDDLAQGDIVAVMEKVGQGMPGQSSSATAKFARHNGHLDMALYALGIPTTLVTPQKWQHHFSNQIGLSKGLAKNDWKNKLKALAQAQCPYLNNITLKTADAILIALYGGNIEL